MNVYLEPEGLYSRAMIRVARALERHMPVTHRIVRDKRKADIVLLHTIGADTLDAAALHIARGQHYIVAQYCLRSTSASPGDWLPCWERALFVWSYYNLHRVTESRAFTFIHTPLGIDPVFLPPQPLLSGHREPLLVTSGYVSGPGAEPIQECWDAAGRSGYRVVHIGPPHVVGCAPPPSHVETQLGVSDPHLANLLRRARFVSALRHMEGFELPGLEGLACGAIPLTFAHTCYESVAWYPSAQIPESHGEDLTAKISNLLQVPPDALDTPNWTLYSWARIAGQFWDTVAARVQELG